MSPCSRLRPVASVLFGLLLAFTVTEVVFRARDHASFPLLNIYEADPICGVRLRPRDETTVSLRGGPPRLIRTQSLGFRGPEWPPPAANDILILGDSQPFGLGVEENERFPARLSGLLPSANAVLDASVPTYGPIEYRVTMERLLAKRHPGTVVVAINLLNDLWELARPNSERHGAVDGWAARSDSIAVDQTSSPLRELLLRRSHMAFAWWRWQRSRAAHLDLSTPDEIDDLVDQATKAGDAERAGREQAEAGLATELLVREAEDARTKAEAELVAVARRTSMLAGYDSALSQEWRAYVRSAGDPSDEVFTLTYGGCAPPPRGYSYRSRARFRGSRIKDDVENLMRNYSRAASDKTAREISEALARRDLADETATKMRVIGPPPPPPPPPELPMSPYFETMSELTRDAGARLVILFLPIDAQIDDAARQRRGLSAATVEDLDVLTASLARSARSFDADAVDPTSALREGGPSTYLPDGHLSAAGHDIVARVLAADMAP